MAKFARLLPFGRFQTPIRTFAHPSTSQRVTVVAVNHFGTDRYFRGLLTAITDRQRGGAIVLSEGADMVTNDPIAATAGKQIGTTAGEGIEATPAERTALASMRAVNDHMVEVFARFGWVHESQVIGTPAGWRYVDLSHEDIIRQTGAAAFQHIADSATTGKTGQALDPRLTRARLLLQLAFSLRLIAVLPARLQSEIKFDDIDAVVLEQRNKLVLDTIDTTSADVVVWWGARHLPGLTAGLTARGYQQTGRDSWRTVGTLPPISTSLWRLLAARRAVARDAKAVVR